MNKKLKTALVGAILTVILLTGCTAEGNVAQVSEPQSVAKLAVNKEEDTKNKKLISDYFVKMYSEPVANYQKNSETGTIPDELRTFIAKRTIDEGNNNTELGLNFPRYIGLNGSTLITYKPLMEPDNKEQPRINSTFIEEKEGTLLYFVKVGLTAECIPDDMFDVKFKLNESSNTYQKTAEVSSNVIDEMLIETRYDIELVKEGESYKILRAVESTFKQGARNRLFRYNNDFVTRLTYLNLKKISDNKEYINKENGEVYEKEKAAITSFFDNVLSLDSERRTLLVGCWNKNSTDFKNLIQVIGINMDKDKKDILTIDTAYKEKLPKEALLLKNDLNKVKIKDGYQISLHPAYSKLRKWYIVTFVAAVEKKAGVLGNEDDYNFDYLVKLTGQDDIKIDSIKLNNMSAVVNTKGTK